MSIYWAFVIIVVGSYIIGNINFARIFTFGFIKKDITKVGSKNPGTMNVLRTQGFGEAIITLFFEAVKSGVPALIAYYVMGKHFEGTGDLAYFVSAFFVIVGHCFPVFYKFKGGKGVACTFGMFTFHPHFWWISLIMFVVCFLLFMFLIKFGSVISFIYIWGMSIIATCMFAMGKYEFLVYLLLVVWFNLVLILVKHRGNIKRLIEGTESKLDFYAKIKSFYLKRKQRRLERLGMLKPEDKAELEVELENVEDTTEEENEDE